jgi:aspartyl-tRNA(Asn)/glutamyl-tRNA(Gln) amidotransferase subunit A
MAAWGNSATRIAAAVAAGEVSAGTVDAAFAGRCDQLESSLFAWAALDGAGAMSQAASVVAGRPLSGVPVGIKDVIDVCGFATRAGSRSREAMPVAEADAPVVARLREAGAVIMGKTVTTEYAMLDPAPTRNPHRLSHTPGGSSSGSAAAVAAGMVPLALGTQTAGSLCRPAAYCGIAAYKPSYGRGAGGGLVPLAPSFDTIGVMGRRVADVRLAGSVIVGQALPVSDDKGPIACLRASEYEASVPDMRELYARAAAALREAGHAVEEIGLDVDLTGVVRDHRAVMASEAYAAHGDLLQLPAGLVGPRFAGLLAEGRALTADDVRSARERLALARDSVWRALRGVSAVLLQPAPGPAPAGLSATGPIHYIVPWTVFGGPLVVVPGGLSAQGLPLGAMIGAAPGEDAVALSIAERLAARIDSLPDMAGDTAAERQRGVAE